MKLTRDGWGGLAVLAASLFLFGFTLELKPSPLVPIGPGFYPRIVLGLAALLGASLLVWDLVRPKARPSAPANYGAVVLHFVLFAAYAAALPGLGFRISTFLYVALANAVMAPPRRPSEWIRVLLLALGTVVVTYAVFDMYLSVLLPRGRWTDW